MNFKKRTFVIILVGAFSGLFTGICFHLMISYISDHLANMGQQFQVFTPVVFGIAAGIYTGKFTAGFWKNSDATTRG